MTGVDVHATTDTGGDALSPVKRAIVEIRDLKARLAAAEQREREPIAIVGFGVRLPGGVHDAASFWSLLSRGVDAISEVPADRWSAAELYDADPDAPGKMNTRWGGFLDGVDEFDNGFFGISPREAESLDPQQRLLLEVTWEALENANIPADRLFGSRAGVFLGIANSDYMRMLLADENEIDTYTTTGNALSIAAGRLAYVLGAQGPAISVDTACSSSLVAVHLAVQSLRSRESDLALAGGVNLILSPELTINFSRARMMAADGRCKTFDAAADGYVRSEGCGMVVLKRLGDAVADGDTVLALIRGSAVNQDGRSGGLTAPNGPSQEQVVRAALASAGVAAADVGYVEAHGTGTLLGDPIELRALAAALCSERSPDRPLLVGSVKTNIGHTESAAGIAGLIKVVLMLQHGVVPPHLHLQQLNPHIAAGNLPISVPTATTDWPAQGGRVAGVSSFGLSGTNAHVIVGEPPSTAGPQVDASGQPGTAIPPILTLSARSDGALRDLATRHIGVLALDPGRDIVDVARTTNLGRAHLPYRLAVVAPDGAAAVERLNAFLFGDPLTDGSAAFADKRTAGGSAGGGIALLFTGHGSHEPGAGRQLYETEPAFAAAIDRCASSLRGEISEPLTDVLFGDGTLLRGMALAQPALFSLQYALAELWASWGIRPSIVAGHSAGEFVAAAVAGVFSLDDGLRLIAARGRLMASLPDEGEMAALFVGEQTVAAAVAPRSADVGIAAVNGPQTTVISGRRDAVAAVIAELGLDADEVRRLDVSVAAHSPLIEPIVPAFAGAVATVAALHRPSLGFVSSMTGRFVDREVTEPEYWARHLREPVRFAAVFDALREAGCSTFVEIGAHPTLLGLGRRNWPDAKATWVPSLHRGNADEGAQIAAGLASLYAGGADIDWAAADRRREPGEPRRPLTALPSYPWQRSRHWSQRAVRGSRGPVGRRWSAAVEAAAVQATQGPLDLHPDAYKLRFAQLTELAVRAIANALRKIGLFADGGEEHTVSDLFGNGRLLPGYDHLGRRWLEHLTAAGLLTVNGDRFVSPAPLPVADIDAIAVGLRPGFADVEPLLDYVARCGSHLAAVVTGGESALGMLFPDGSYETVDFIYGGWAVPRYFNGIVRAAAAAVAAGAPGRPLRVLEIGAGTGGTTAAVLPALPADCTSYTFTDVSDFFLSRAADRFAAFPFVRYARLDIEQPPAAQGHDDGSYDMVIAANVLHATRNLDVTLANVRAALAPGGVLIAYEGTEHPDWFDITTGLIEGWQRFDDGWRTDVPLIGPERWAEALAAAGFDDVASFPGEGTPASGLLHHVVVARADGDESVASGGSRRSDTVLIDDRALAPLAVVADVRGLLAAALPDERHDVLVDAVRASVARVLRVADPSRLQRDQPLLDLGFDSLMAIELRNVLGTALALARKLPATLVFDYPTIAAIATHLETLLDEGAQAAPVTTSSVPSGRRLLHASDMADISDDEVEAMLLARLTDIER
ncbi:MAG: type I polyketide synthase [Ilumatobacteraceae bacterium]